jgi:flagellar basal body-associated protein FliL
MKRGKRKTKKVDREIKKAVKSKKKEFNKKIIIILAIIVLFLLMLAILSLLLKNPTPTTKVIEKPPTPENCSNQNIKKAWEFVFKGSSENITLSRITENLMNETNLSEEDNALWEMFFPRGCPVYNAYQINGNNVRIIFGTDMWFFMNIKGIIAIDAEYTPEAIANLTEKLNSEEYLDGNRFVMEEFLENSTIQRNINTTEEAKSEFESVFKISSSNWTKEENTDFEGANVSLFGFVENETLKNITLFGESIDPIGTIAKAGMVFQNYSINMYTYVDVSILSSIEELEKKFGNWTSPINTSLEGITIEVNNSRLKMSEELSLFSEPHSGIQEVKILENGKTRIETEVNFTNDFDWTKIILKKQDEESERGYIIINGLNYTKNVTVDKLDDNSHSICIKDKEINFISEISDECNSANEYLLNCSENNKTRLGNFTCKVYKKKFIVTGLTHSGIVEMIPPEQCTPDWTCDEWTNYEKNCGYRTCTDLNDCGNISNKPIEQGECPVCIPNWECTDFSPEKCPKAETKTRTCTDINNCKTSQGEPSLTQTCKRTKTSTWIIIGAVLIILMVLIIILSLERKRRQAETSKKIPVTHEKNYKEDPNYPSNLEQGYSLERTYEFGPPINPDKEED